MRLDRPFSDDTGLKRVTDIFSEIRKPDFRLEIKQELANAG